QAEDGIRDFHVTGVQTCALPISDWQPPAERHGWLSCKCPFHGDNNPSASVNLKVNAFKCHSCDMKGDLISLLKRKEGVGYGEAVKFAERVLDGSLPPVQKTRKGKPPRRVYGESRTAPVSQKVQFGVRRRTS